MKNLLAEAQSIVKECMHNSPALADIQAEGSVLNHRLAMRKYYAVLVMAALDALTAAPQHHFEEAKMQAIFRVQQKTREFSDCGTIDRLAIIENPTEVILPRISFGGKLRRSRHWSETEHPGDI